MVSIEEATTVFPEVELESIQKIYEHYDNDPSLAQIANVLMQAAEQGKVPDSDYAGRVENPVPVDETRLHPEVAEEIEKMGFDPKEAEEGLQVQQEVERGEWEEKAIEIVDGGDLTDIIDFYIRLSDMTKKMLKSPTRSDIPEDVDIAASIISNEIQDRIEAAGMSGDIEEIERVTEQIVRVPEEEIREAYLEILRPWRRLATNQGEEFDEAREWVFSARGEEMVDRIESLKDGAVYDVTTEQLMRIIEDAEDELAPDL